MLTEDLWAFRIMGDIRSSSSSDGVCTCFQPLKRVLESLLIVPLKTVPGVPVEKY